MREERLPETTWRELCPCVPEDADSHDSNVDGVAVHLRHTSDRALGDAPLADDAVHACHHLRAVRKRHGARIEPFEVAQPKVHAMRSQAIS